MDSYFNLKGCDAVIETEQHEVLRCFLPKGHAGAHESVNGGLEWWDAALTHEGPFLVPVSEAELRDVANSLGLVRGTFRTINTDNIKNRILMHLRTAPEREAIRLKEWARGYDDGIRTALGIMNREEE